MKPGTIRFFDYWLGVPACAALTQVRRVRDLFGRPPRGPVKKVLIIKMIEQGATVLAHAAIARAVELVGRENVYFWVFAKNRPILDVMDLLPVENVLAIRDDSLLSFGADVLRTLWKIRRLRIDATVDMEFFTRAPAILACLTGASRRVGLHRFTSEQPYRGDLLTHRVQHNPYLHTSVAYDLLVQSLTRDRTEMPMPKVRPAERDLCPPKFQPATDEVQRVQGILERVAGRRIAGPIVLLNPNASDMLPLRRWATENFVELGRRVLEEDPRATVVITGAPDEREAAAEIAKQISPDRAISVAGETTLRELIVLYTLADALVTNDSGPGHFASLTDLPTLVLFGPETPALFGPLGRNVQSMSANLACSPCVSALNHRFSPCQDNVCMQRISVDEVYGRLHRMLHPGVAPERGVEVTLHLPPRLAVARQKE
jgi:ADP-heptose:LPS heptosyltransferase